MTPGPANNLEEYMKQLSWHLEDDPNVRRAMYSNLVPLGDRETPKIVDDFEAIHHRPKAQRSVSAYPAITHMSNDTANSTTTTAATASSSSSSSLSQSTARLPPTRALSTNDFTL